MAITELLTSDWQRYLNQPRMCPYFGKHLFCKTRTDYAKGRQESQQPTRPNYNDLYRNTPFSSLRWDNIRKAIIILYIQELTEGAVLSFIARNASARVVVHSINTYSVVFTWAGITVISIWWEIKNATL